MGQGEIEYQVNGGRRDLIVLQAVNGIAVILPKIGAADAVEIADASAGWKQ